MWGMARTRCRLAAESISHDVKSRPVERLGLGTIAEVGIKLRDEHQSSGNGETVTCMPLGRRSEALKAARRLLSDTVIG